ncbi:MAG: CHAT domain-containing protein, partial [Geminicoccaceae bacterium]|nr:CHAT domain-containing protein [Geminicoccaceae bacterium]
RTAARALINAGRAEVRLGRADAALAALDAAEGELDASGAAGDDASILDRLTIAAVALEAAQKWPDRLERAYDAVRRASTAADGAGARDRSWALGLEGELYAAAGREEEALTLYRRAALAAEAAAAPEVLYRWQWRVGRILAGRGQTEEAIAAYRSAAANLDTVRLDLPAFDPQTGRSLFRETLGPVFTELADLLLERADGEAASRPGESRESAQADLIEARGTVERLKTIELEDYFRDDCAADLSARVRPIDQPEPGTAVLYPVLLEDRTELVVSLPDGSLTSASSDAGSSRITLLAQQLRAAIDGADGTLGDFAPPARALYDELIRPIEPALLAQNVQTLVFIPDGVLRNIPLSVLLDGDTFLVQRFAVATGIGLSLLDTSPIQRDNLNILVAGLSEERQDVPIGPGRTETFDALPGVETELRALESAVAPEVELMNAGFTAEALREELTETPFNVVHLATHGWFTGDPDYSFVLAYDEPLKMNELEEIIGISRFRDQPIELLTLSACQTAAGDDRSALGLAGVAVKVGARSAFATLWNIADESTVEVVTSFYDNLVQPGVNKAEALRRAQLELIASGGQLAHPYFWSPYLIIGNWL